MGLLLLCIVIALIVIVCIHNSPRGETNLVMRLDPDAKITDMKTESVGKNLETTVVFSDGYRYITRDHDTGRGFGYITRTVTPEVRMRIIKAALEKHEEEYQDYLERKQKYGHV